MIALGSQRQSSRAQSHQMGSQTGTQANNRVASRVGAKVMDQVGKHVGPRLVKKLWNQVTNREDNDGLGNDAVDGAVYGLSGCWMLLTQLGDPFSALLVFMNHVASPDSPLFDLMRSRNAR